MYAVPPPRPSPAANGVRKPAAPPEPIRLGRLFFHSAAAAYMLAAYLSLGKAMAKLTPAKEEVCIFSKAGIGVDGRRLDADDDSTAASCVS